MQAIRLGLWFPSEIDHDTIRGCDESQIVMQGKNKAVEAVPFFGTEAQRPINSYVMQSEHAYCEHPFS